MEEKFKFILSDAKQSLGKSRKLGLALSGGGFRASFFHLGVLRRLAELDLLRRVAVLSTVSGGSIVAAHYYLRLKEAMARGSMTQASYENVVDQVKNEFLEGVDKNLRTRLFANPIASLVLFVTGGSLGRRMAHLYTKHLFQSALHELLQNPLNRWGQLNKKKVLREGAPLHDLKFTLFDGQLNQKLEADLETFNADPGNNTVPKFVLNATCLNTACAFRFSITEVGDPELGYLRFDEVDLVLWHKRLLESLPSDMASLQLVQKEIKTRLPNKPGGSGEFPKPVHVLWFHRCKHVLAKGEGEIKPENGSNADLLAADFPLGDEDPNNWLFHNWPISKTLVLARFEELRNAKLSAFWLRRMATRDHPRLGGRTRAEWLAKFWDAIDDIDPELRKTLEGRFGSDDPGLRDLFLDLYYLRSGVAFASSAKIALNKLTLSHAVAASANFPPVFAPFMIKDLYDARNNVSVLALSDGGVFDNQGIEALRDEDCTDIIASDAGGLLSVQPNPSRLRGAMMVRIAGILMANLRDFQLGSLREEARVTKGIVNLSPKDDSEELHDRYQLRNLAFFHMTSNPNDALPSGPPPLPAHSLAARIAQLRTDLDAFCQIETDALIYQGYQLADRFVRTYLADYMSDLNLRPPGPPKDPIDPVNQSYSRRVHQPENRQVTVLEAGKQRVGRIFAIYSTETKLAGVIAGLMLLVLLVWSRASLHSIAQGVLGPVDRFLALPFSLPAVRWALTTTFGAAALAVIIAGLGILIWWQHRTRFRWPIPARNWLWLVYGLPLLLTLIGGAVGGFILFIVTPISLYVGRRS